MTRSSDPVNIGLKRDQILQRFLARRIWKELELRIVETDGTEHVGFITGLDDRCIQLSTSPVNESDHVRAVLVFWPLRRIEETGRRMSDLDYEHVSRIRAYSQVLWKQCAAVMKTNGPTPSRNGHHSEPETAYSGL